MTETSHLWALKTVSGHYCRDYANGGCPPRLFVRLREARAWAREAKAHKLIVKPVKVRLTVTVEELS